MFKLVTRSQAEPSSTAIFRGFHRNIPAPLPAIRESFRIHDEQRLFDRTLFRWVVAILVLMFVTVAPAVFYFISQLPE